MIDHLLAAATANPFGVVVPPAAIGRIASDPGAGIGKLLSFGIRLLIVLAGVYALINLVLAGYAFISAGDDPKKVTAAWTKIWQTLLGLAVAAGAFVLASIFGQLLFNDPTFILKPSIPVLK